MQKVARVTLPGHLLFGFNQLVIKKFVKTLTSQTSAFNETKPKKSMNMEQKNVKDCLSVILVIFGRQRVGKKSLLCYQFPLLKQRDLKSQALKQMLPLILKREKENNKH